ncbi:MAG: 30S ribosome-binding factor RbfA [Clostridiaceae bacterium]|nr:30S ribosome-binding factor RbfA [Clostridiaceae bacterium]
MLRSERVSEEIKKVAARIIQNEVKDPRLSEFTTVTDVKVSRDLAYATIYVSVLGEAEQIQQTLDILNRAKKFIRYRIGQEVKLRLVPEIRFDYDNSIAEGNRMSKIIDEVIAQDEKNRIQRENEK